MRGRPPLRDARAAAVALSRLEGAGVPVLEHRFGPGEQVYLRGDADRGLCFLLEGTLRVYKAYGGGSAEATVGLLAGGGLFGEPSLRAGGRHRDSAEALSACRVARVPKGPLGAHLLRDPDCSFPLLLALAVWVEQREAAAARMVPWEVGGRLARLLLELAERFGRETERGTEVGLRLTHHDLARMVACTREAVTKEMSRFRRAGLVEARGRGRVVVLDGPRLVDLARAGSARSTVYSTA
jgi:CRP/FNR family cyclic AMP-dependent transcriptional regulator